MLREIERSKRFHHTQKVMLFTHHDCGAYGGIASFDGSKDKELAYHRAEHKKAKDVVNMGFPEMSVESYFVDTHGVVKIV